MATLSYNLNTNKDHLAITPILFLRLEPSGSEIAHFRSAVNRTDAMTRTAPPTEYQFGTSLKNHTCQTKAKTISLLRAIATGPACSICKATVSRI